MTTDIKVYELGDLHEVHKRRLLEAARTASIQEVEALLEMGISANIRDELGMSPLMLCCIADTRDELHSVHRHGRKEATSVAMALLEHSADMDAIGPGGWPPIFFAAFYCDFDVMRALIHAQCDVNIRDESGRSLASWARYGDQDREHQKAVLKMLYRHGFPPPVEAKVKLGQLLVRASALATSDAPSEVARVPKGLLPPHFVAGTRGVRGIKRPQRHPAPKEA